MQERTAREPQIVGGQARRHDRRAESRAGSDSECVVRCTGRNAAVRETAL